MQESSVGEALGTSAAAGRWPNPEIELGRERVDGSGGRSEETDVWIRQRLDLAGVRAKERDAAQTMVVAARARADMVEREQARDIRRRFYDALAADALLDLAIDWRDRLDVLVTAAVRRVDAGDASRYELLRLQKELSVVQAELLERQAAAESARQRLFGMIGGEPARLSGTLLPPAMDPALVPGLLADHPLLRALDAESESALLSSDAASRRRWPALTLGAGWREVDEAGHRRRRHERREDLPQRLERMTGDPVVVGAASGLFVDARGHRALPGSTDATMIRATPAAQRPRVI
jgi:cobalt-zinc-cadmium efflux system outer membrane protein